MLSFGIVQHFCISASRAPVAYDVMEIIDPHPEFGACYSYEHFRTQFHRKLRRRARTSRTGPLSCSSRLPGSSNPGWIRMGTKAF